jgi:uncharacterized protein (TIGR00299 family) protein
LRILYFDCFSGAAGDMLLGALIDAGVPLADVRRALGTLAVDAEAVWTDRVTRAGIGATKFRVRGEDGDPGREQRPAAHAHRAAPHEHAAGALEQGARAHEHGATPHGHESPAHQHHHAHRTLAEIERLIDGSALTASGRDTAKGLFARLADEEAAIHGTSPERVYLHEVGGLDSIVDIVGTVYAMETLRPARVVASPLNVGGGSIRSAHGLYPVPAPATARLLRGAPIYAGPQQAELVTPTGALLVTHYASAFGPVPAMTLRGVGYGAGSRDFEDTPNVLRVLVGEADGDVQSHAVTVLEAEIDDMNPQIFGVLMERLLAEGALDVFYTAVQMKKNRPGTLLTAIAPPALRERLTALIFRESTTIGIRYREMTRECLDRETVEVATGLGAVRVKVARRGGEILNAAPEFEDCARIAAERDLPLKDVQAAALKAFLDSRAPAGRAH